MAYFFFLVACSSLLLQVLEAGASPAPRAIIFLLADDLGYNEIGAQNSSRGLQTPHIDALAAGGVRLTQYYTNPLCSPTRSALMTGKYNHRLGTQSNVIFWDTPWSVPLEHAFLPQRLKEIPGHGSTAMYGKSHLGMHDRRFWPVNRGFDDHSGYFQGCGGYGSHVASCCDAPSPNASDFLNYICASGEGKDYRGYDWFHNLDAVPAYNGTSSSEVIAGLAEAAIAKFTAAGPSPFFLYLPFQNIHAPYDALQASVDRFAHLPVSPQQKQMFGYLYELDVAIGRVTAALQAAGVLQDSVVVFASDNGAPSAPGVEDRNYPLKGFKSETYEGGTRVPALVFAPGRVPAGGVCDALVHVTDWVPTLVAVAGGSIAPGEHLDGVNVWGNLAAPGASPSIRQEVVHVSCCCCFCFLFFVQFCAPHRASPHPSSPPLSPARPKPFGEQHAHEHTHTHAHARTRTHKRPSRPAPPGRTSTPCAPGGSLAAPRLRCAWGT
jgi:arylsulfatase A-like enzyme